MMRDYRHGLWLYGGRVTDAESLLGGVSNDKDEMIAVEHGGSRYRLGIFNIIRLGVIPGGESA